MFKQLVFDVNEADVDNDNVGAFIRSSDGTLITHTTDGAREAIDVFTELGVAEDSAHNSGDIGMMPLAVRNDTPGSLVDTDGDYTPLQVDADGNLRVSAVVNVDSNSDYAEDTAHTNGDTGEMILAVRNDTLASLVDTDGDYSALQVDADGALYVNVASSGELTVNDAALANTGIANAANTLSVADTAQDVVASPLANRKYLLIHNEANKRVFIGASGVTESNGLPLPPKALMMLRAGASVDIEFVGKSGDTPEIRTLELS